MENADLDHVRVVCLGLTHPVPQHLARPVKGRCRWHQHRQAVDLNCRPVPLFTHVVDQLHGFPRAFVLVDVRVVMAGKHAVERIRHPLGDVAVQIKGRGHRHRFADQAPHGHGQVSFKIRAAIHHPGAMQVEKHPVHRHRRGQALQDLRLHLVVGVRRNDPRGLGGGHHDGDRGHAKFQAGIDRGTGLRLRASHPHHLLAARDVEISQLRLIFAVGVGLVNDARNGNSQAHAQTLSCFWGAIAEPEMAAPPATPESPAPARPAPAARRSRERIPDRPGPPGRAPGPAARAAGWACASAES